MLTVLIPRSGYIEVLEVSEKNITIRKLPRSYDLNILKEGWNDQRC